MIDRSLMKDCINVDENCEFQDCKSCTFFEPVNALLSCDICYCSSTDEKFFEYHSCSSYDID